MIVIIDYGVGNLFSLKCSLAAIGENAVVSSDVDIIRSADRIILPGVGAFEDAAKKLRDCGLDKVVVEEAKKGKPLLGICLGMQMLFEKSYEYGEHKGLGLIPGAVVPIKGEVAEELKIPHIGWNPLHIRQPKDDLYKYIDDGDSVYFVHSYYASGCEPYVTATSEYGKELTASVRRDNVWGAQFHPEKSGRVGLSILKAFCETETIK